MRPIFIVARYYAPARIALLSVVFRDAKAMRVRSASRAQTPWASARVAPEQFLRCTRLRHHDAKSSSRTKVLSA
jgi:hypothetical protein